MKAIIGFMFFDFEKKESKIREESLRHDPAHMLFWIDPNTQ